MSRYVFLDGEAFLQFVTSAAQRVSPGEEVPVNYGKLLGHLKAVRGFFYDAYPTKGATENASQFQARWDEKHAFLRGLSRVDRMHVRPGISRHRKGRGLEQKGVDIQLAIEVYQHAVRGNMEDAVLITNDLDFFPLLDALTQTHVITELLYVAGKTSETLIEAADRARPLSLHEFLRWCDHPYSEHGQCAWGSGFKADQVSQMKTGQLGSQKLVVYRDKERELFVLSWEGEDRTLSCRNLQVGIELLELDTGEKVEL